MIRIMVYQVIEADGSAIMQLRSKQAAQFEMQLLIEHNNPTNPTYKMPISIREVVLETDDIGEKISQKSSMEKWDKIVSEVAILCIEDAIEHALENGGGMTTADFKTSAMEQFQVDTFHRALKTRIAELLEITPATDAV